MPVLNFRFNSRGNVLGGEENRSGNCPVGYVWGEGGGGECPCGRLGAGNTWGPAGLPLSRVSCL